MEYILVFVAIAFALQIGIFIYGKNKRKSATKGPAILEKYGIKSRGDLFKLINSHHIPEEDRIMLEDHYQKGL